MNERNKSAASKVSGKGKIQGEGDYASDRVYRERTDRFLKSADVDDLAHKAAPKSDADADEMAKAEQEGKSHARTPGRTTASKKRKVAR